MKRILELVLDLALLAALGVVMLGANGPVRRYWNEWRDNVHTQQMIRTEWNELADGTLRLDGTPVDSQQTGPTVIEFADFQCPYCARAVDTVDAFLQRHPEAHVVFRNFPIKTIHAGAEAAAAAAVCAQAQGRFRELYRWLFTTDDWKRAPDWGRAAIAVAVPDTSAFGKCLVDPATTDRVGKDSGLGRRVGVSGTPTFVSRRGRHEGIITVRELEKLAGI